MTAYLDEQIAIAEAATLGPWEHDEYGTIWDARREQIASVTFATPNDRDATFIAASGAHRLAELRALKLAYKALLLWRDAHEDAPMAAEAAFRTIEELGK